MTAQYTKMSDAPFHIGMLHGSVEGDAEHNRYAPFQIRELKEKLFDYWALGHIHKREILSEEPYMIYPGTYKVVIVRKQARRVRTLLNLRNKERNVHFSIRQMLYGMRLKFVLMDLKLLMNL